MQLAIYIAKPFIIIIKHTRVVWQTTLSFYKEQPKKVCMAICTRLCSGGGRGAIGARAPPTFHKRGRAPPKYVCVTSSASREQYWYS